MDWGSWTTRANNASTCEASKNVRALTRIAAVFCESWHSLTHLSTLGTADRSAQTCFSMSDAGPSNTTHAAEESSLPPQLESLSKLIAEQPETLATGADDLRRTALEAAKYVFDLGMFALRYTLASLTP